MQRIALVPKAGTSDRTPVVVKDDDHLEALITQHGADIEVQDLDDDGKPVPKAEAVVDATLTQAQRDGGVQDPGAGQQDGQDAGAGNDGGAV